MKTFALATVVSLTFTACGAPEVSDVETDVDLAPALTGIEVRTIEPQFHFTIKSAQGSLLVKSNEVIELLPGIYRIQDQQNPEFVYAEPVEVVEGNVTTVSLGAILLNTVPGADHTDYAIYDAQGEKVLRHLSHAHVLSTVPAGRYRLKDYGARKLVYADVEVVPAEVTEVAMGAIVLEAEEDAYHTNFTLHASPTEPASLRPLNHANRPVTAPAGTFTLRDYGHSQNFIYFPAVTVAWGEVTTVRLGTLEYAGAQYYDLFEPDCDTLLAEYHSAGERVALPPRTYCIREYGKPVILGMVTVD